jgi:integrase/recombinase XerD
MNDSSLITRDAAPAVRRPADSDAQLIDLWLHGRSPETQRAYRRDVDAFLAFTSKPLDRVGLADLQGFYEALTTQPASRQRTVRAVKSLIGFAHRIGYLPFDVGAALVLRRLSGAVAARILDRESVLRMIALEGDARNRAMLMLLYDSGVRVSELVALTWADLQPRDNGCGQVTVIGKGNKARVILIGPKVCSALRSLPAGDRPAAPMFASKSRGPLDQSMVWRIVRRAARRAGIDAAVSTHWLRHACASHALDGGAPVHLVQQQLGHASLETTTQYSHARPDDGLFRYLKG